MGSDTGFTVKTVRYPGRGSDYFGPCEICKKQMSEAAAFETHRIFKHKEGFLYLSAPSPSVYAHIACQPHSGTRIVSKSTLPGRGRLVEYPRYALQQDLMNAGLSEKSAQEAIDALTALD